MGHHNALRPCDAAGFYRGGLGVYFQRSRGGLHVEADLVGDPLRPLLFGLPDSPVASKRHGVRPRVRIVPLRPQPACAARTGGQRAQRWIADLLRPVRGLRAAAATARRRVVAGAALRACEIARRLHLGVSRGLPDVEARVARAEARVARMRLVAADPESDIVSDRRVITEYGQHRIAYTEFTSSFANRRAPWNGNTLRKDLCARPSPLLGALRRLLPVAMVEAAQSERLDPRTGIHFFGAADRTCGMVLPLVRRLAPPVRRVNRFCATA